MKLSDIKFPDTGCDVNNKKRRFQITRGAMPGGEAVAGFDDSVQAERALKMYASPRVNPLEYFLYDNGAEMKRMLTPSSKSMGTPGSLTKKVSSK